MLHSLNYLKLLMVERCCYFFWNYGRCEVANFLHFEVLNFERFRAVLRFDKLVVLDYLNALTTKMNYWIVEALDYSYYLLVLLHFLPLLHLH